MWPDVQYNQDGRIYATGRSLDDSACAPLRMSGPGVGHEPPASGRVYSVQTVRQRPCLLAVALAKAGRALLRRSGGGTGGWFEMLVTRRRLP